MSIKCHKLNIVFEFIMCLWKLKKKRRRKKHNPCLIRGGFSYICVERSGKTEKKNT